MESYGVQERVKNGPALAGRGAEAVRDAIAKELTGLPEQLLRSLTWDRGKPPSCPQQPYGPPPQMPHEVPAISKKRGLSGRSHMTYLVLTIVTCGMWGSSCGRRGGCSAAILETRQQPGGAGLPQDERCAWLPHSWPPVTRGRYLASGQAMTGGQSATPPPYIDPSVRLDVVAVGKGLDGMVGTGGDGLSVDTRLNDDPRAVHCDAAVLSGTRGHGPHVPPA
jgi:hypothetical protein